MAGATGQNTRVRRRGILFGGGTGTTVTDLEGSPELAAFQRQVTNSQNVIVQLGEAIGRTVSNFASNGNVTNLAEYNDLLARRALGETDFVRAGETSLEALARLGADFASFNAEFDMFGFSLGNVTPIAANAASEILRLAGGIEAITPGLATIFGFRPPEEQARLLREQLESVLDVVPETRADFAAYSDDILARSSDSRLTQAERDAAAQEFVDLTQNAQRFNDFLTIGAGIDPATGNPFPASRFSSSRGSSVRDISLNSDNFRTIEEENIANAVANNALQAIESDKARERLQEQIVEEVRQGGVNTVRAVISRNRPTADEVRARELAVRNA